MADLVGSIPVDIDQLLSLIAREVHASVRNAIGKVTDRTTVTMNLMYRIPRIGARLHFAHLPSDEVDAEKSIAGRKSVYFAALDSLKVNSDRQRSPSSKAGASGRDITTGAFAASLHPGDQPEEPLIPVPDRPEIEALSRFALRCPHAICSINNIMWKLRTLDLSRHKALFSEMLDEDPHRVLVAITSRFARLDADFINALETYKLLPLTVHCLLSFLPQFDDTPAAAMGRHGKRPGTERHGVWWLSQAEKTELWGTHLGTVSARDRVFYLLSVVESLQWHENTGFGIIDSLYDFLGYKKREVPRAARQYGLALKQLGLYFNCKPVEERGQQELADNIRKAILAHVRSLGQLVVATASAMSRAEQFAFAPLLPSEPAVVAAGLLNILSPNSVSYCECLWTDQAHRHAGGVRRRYRDDELAQLDAGQAVGSTTGFLEILDSPWGVYPDATVDHKCLGEPCTDGLTIATNLLKLNFLLPHGRHGSVSMAYTDPKSDPSVVAESDPIYMGDLLCRMQSLLAPSRTGFTMDWATRVFETFYSNPQIPPNWYRTAFDRFYIAFDRHRQDTRRDIKEFELRQDREAEFYADLLRRYFPPSLSCLNVVDVGVGYGRLARRLRDKLSVTLNYHGIDLSPPMIAAARKVLGAASTLKLGEMDQELAGAQEWTGVVDLVILSYSTFGCYADHSRNLRVLESIAPLLRPGGVLVIEQHNPATVRPARPVMCLGPLTTREGVELHLVKTTEFSGADGTCTRYRGAYWYFANSGGSPRHIKYTPYEVNLYTPDWLATNLAQLGIATTFCSDFQLDERYDGTEAATLMICIGVKDALGKDVMTIGLDAARELIDNIKRTMPEELRVPDAKKQTLDSRLSRAKQQPTKLAAAGRVTEEEVRMVKEAATMKSDDGIRKGLGIVLKWLDVVERWG